MPTLMDGKQSFTQSLVIIEYLDRVLKSLPIVRKVYEFCDKQPAFRSAVPENQANATKDCTHRELADCI